MPSSTGCDGIGGWELQLRYTTLYATYETKASHEWQWQRIISPRLKDLLVIVQLQKKKKKLKSKKKKKKKTEMQNS